MSWQRRARFAVAAIGLGCAASLYFLARPQKPVAPAFQTASRDPDAFAVAAPDRRFAPALEAVVMRALARDPAERFQSAAALRQALIEVLHRGTTRFDMGNHHFPALGRTALAEELAKVCGGAMQ